MLHGDVKINNTVIGQWSAGRIRPYDVRAYECHIEFRDNHGYPCEATWVLTEPNADGAMLLAARVLSEGFVKAKRKQPDGSI